MVDNELITKVRTRNVKSILSNVFTSSGGGGGTWGSITGTLSDQTDLQAALNAKANSLGADDNYVTDAEKTKLSNLSGTNTGDQDLSSYATTAAVAAGYQPLDSDLTTIAGLTATTDNFIQSKSSAWASRTPAQVKADLNVIYLPLITGYLGSGTAASKEVATAVDQIPTASLSVGERISAIVTISGTQRRLYTAELVVPADSTAGIEVSPSVIRPNDFNSVTNNKVWREIKNSGIIDVSNYGVLPDAAVYVSDQVAAIITAASAGDTLVFPSGSYLIYGITVSKALNFVGFGAKFIFSTVNAPHFAITVDLVTFRGFTFKGQGRAHASYPLQGAINITGCSNILISECLFDTMPFYCIRTNSTHISDTSSDFGSINVVNCHMMRSKYGIYANTRGEYVNYNGCSIVDCNEGAYIGAGNINICGSNILDCSVVGIRLVTDVNDAHGTITGCQINHNTKSIIGSSIVNGEFFRSNNIYYGDMEFTNCAAIEFHSCTIGALEVKFDNCTGCKISGCTLDDTTTTTLTTNWNSNQSDVIGYDNRNLANKLSLGWNIGPLLSIFQHTSTTATNYVVSKVKLAASEAMIVKGFVMGVRVDTSPNDYTEAYYREFTSLFRRQTGGNITKVGEQLGTAITDGAFGGSFQINANTTDQTCEVEVIPDADDTLWTVQFSYTKSSLIPGLLI